MFPGVKLTRRRSTSLRRRVSFSRWPIIKMYRRRSSTSWRNHSRSAIIRSKQEIFAGNLGYHDLKIIRFNVICCSIGPIFGAGADLLISSNCNANKESYSNLPHSYDGDHASNQLLMGDYHFSVIDYEVFTLSHPVSKSNH